MWPEKLSRLESEWDSLQRELDETSPLRDKSLLSSPDNMEIRALANILQSIYNGLEQIMTKIALNLDGRLPEGDKFHEKLIRQLTEPTYARSAVLDQETSELLQKYRAFRHFQRHNYGYLLQWNQMQSLVIDIPVLMKHFRNCLDLLKNKLSS